MHELDLFQRVAAWLVEGRTVWLCTVLSTWGSAPRPPGALLACTHDKQVIGSLSGGCVEDDLLERIAAGQYDQPVTRIRYGATADEAERLRLPCGGILDILVERILPGAETIRVIGEITVALGARQRICFLRDYRQGHMATDVPASRQQPLLLTETEEGQPASLGQCLGPAFRLVLLGASDVARAVAKVALLLDYDILVCDPREDVRSQWDVAGVTLLDGMPDDVVRQYGQDDHCAILALSHDPRIDDMGLMDAFATRAFYIGAMGSQRTSEKRRARLQLLGVSPEQLARLHAPIGLPTGSRTPAEIAVSVLAELTQVRRSLGLS